MTHSDIVLKSLEETIVFGELLGKYAQPGDIICLDGDLGAGKTTLTQAIAKGLDVVEGTYVSSPSFALIHEYTGRIPLFHMDLYRLGDESDVVDLGLDEYFYKAGLSVVEWAEKASDLFPSSKLGIRLRYIDENNRVAECVFEKKHWGDRFFEINKKRGH